MDNKREPSPSKGLHEYHEKTKYIKKAHRSINLQKIELKLKEQLCDAYTSGFNEENNACADTANYLTGWLVREGYIKEDL